MAKPLIKMNYKVSGKIKQATAKKIKKLVFTEAFRSLKESMDEVGTKYTQRIRNDAKRAFPNASDNFPNTFRGKVYSRNKEYLPTMEHFSKLSYYDIFANGGDINSKNGRKLMIPFGAQGKRRTKASQQKLRMQIAELFRQNAAFIKQYSDYAIIFARLTKGTSKNLTKEKKRFKADSGLKRLSSKNGQVIPVAFLYDKVHLKKRLDFRGKYMKREMKDVYKLQAKKYKTPKII